MRQPIRGQVAARVQTVEKGQGRWRSDRLATEEPLEIRLGQPPQTLAITMRTPGADFDLAAGFLYSEGIIRHRADIRQLSYCVDPAVDGTQQQNIVNVQLREGLTPDVRALERHFFTTSACGVCGKASLEALKIRSHPPIPTIQPVAAEVIYRLPTQLRTIQGLFTQTGGLHAAALFDRQGTCLRVREDVGRHNALDKLLGATLLAEEFPLAAPIILVSGRTSFEILQKSLMAGVPIVCAISAPSSLAVALAKEFGITLVGFLRGDRFNIYAGEARIMTE